MIVCLCDTRERELIPRLGWPVRALPVGDLWLGLSGEQVGPGGLVIERKTAADLEASILDGRYREQRTRLATQCQETGARPLQIIEGSLDRLEGRLSEQALLKHLTRLALRQGIPFFQTDCLETTSRHLLLLQSQMEEDPTVFQAASAAEVMQSSTLSVQKKANRSDPKQFAISVLMNCPGISANHASLILEQGGGTLAGVWNLGAEEIAATSIGKRKLGKVVAHRLYTLLHGLGGDTA